MGEMIPQYELIQAGVGAVLIGAYEMYQGRSAESSVISPAVLLMFAGRLALSYFKMFSMYVEYGLYFVAAVLASGIQLGSMFERPADLLMPAVAAVALKYIIPYVQSMITSYMGKTGGNY